MSSCIYSPGRHAGLDSKVKSWGTPGCPPFSPLPPPSFFEIRDSAICTGSHRESSCTATRASPAQRHTRAPLGARACLRSTRPPGTGGAQPGLQDSSIRNLVVRVGLGEVGRRRRLVDRACKYARGRVSSAAQRRQRAWGAGAARRTARAHRFGGRRGCPALTESRDGVLHLLFPRQNRADVRTDGRPRVV